jgi:hypothetical protein
MMFGLLAARLVLVTMHASVDNRTVFFIMLFFVYNFKLEWWNDVFGDFAGPILGAQASRLCTY